MKLIIFDIGNAFCSIVSSPNGYGMMIDCGSNSEKDCPVDMVKKNKDWLGLRDYQTKSIGSYPLGKLHITHPDDDHVRNALKVEKHLKPFKVVKRMYEEFPCAGTINDEYKNIIDRQYRSVSTEIIDWGFDINKTFRIPMDVLKRDPILSSKLRNNSSIIRYIKHNGVSVLYTGDLEKPAWEWLVANDRELERTISGGIDVFIAPHHGHKSGFPQCVFDIADKAKVIIHSKGSEVGRDDTDVSNRYSENAEGVDYTSLIDNSVYSGKVLTTRSNGHIFIDVTSSSPRVWTSKASCNHQRKYITRNLH